MAAQASLFLAWSETPEDTFVVSWFNCITLRVHSSVLVLCVVIVAWLRYFPYAFIVIFQIKWVLSAEDNIRVTHWNCYGYCAKFIGQNGKLHSPLYCLPRKVDTCFCLDFSFQWLSESIECHFDLVYGRRFLYSKTSHLSDISFSFVLSTNVVVNTVFVTINENKQ